MVPSSPLQLSQADPWSGTTPAIPSSSILDIVDNVLRKPQPFIVWERKLLLFVDRLTPLTLAPSVMTAASLSRI